WRGWSDSPRTRPWSGRVVRPSARRSLASICRPSRSGLAGTGSRSGSSRRSTRASRSWPRARRSASADLESFVTSALGSAHGPRRRSLMFSFPALDVVLGLVLAYFLLSIVCSSINEAIATAFRWRSRDLERAIKQLLGDHEPVFRSHPLIATLIDPARREKMLVEAREAAQKSG